MLIIHKVPENQGDFDTIATQYGRYFKRAGGGGEKEREQARKIGKKGRNEEKREENSEKEKKREGERERKRDKETWREKEGI